MLDGSTDIDLRFGEQTAKFVITREDLNADPVSLAIDALLIGRLASCELVLNHPTVSRVHAGIKQVDGHFYFFNFSDSTGTILNGRGVVIESTEVLADGDLLQIGVFLLHVKFEDGALYLHVKRLMGEQGDSDKDADLGKVSQALDLFWERKWEIVRPEHSLVLAPSLPPRMGFKRVSQKLRQLLRRLIAGISQCDPVDFTVFSPPEVSSGEIFMVQVFAHRPGQAQVANQLAKEFDSDTVRRGFTSLEADIKRGERLEVHLLIPGLGYSHSKVLTWRGEARAVQFAVDVPSALGRRSLVGTVMIRKDYVPLGHIKFKLTVEETGAIADAAKSVPSGESARRYRKAFISYASQDRAEVIKRVQMLARLKINYFQDVLNLEPGMRWQRELYRHIDNSDVFLLFWSRAAKQSEWVMREVNYALRQQSSSAIMLPEIIPVIIEGPPPVEPPPELAHLHFDDYLVYFIR